MQYIGELAALFTAILWSGAAFAFTAAAHRVGSSNANLLRLILASIFLTATIIIFNFQITPSFSQVIYLSLSGFVGIVFGDAFLFQAYQTIGARLSMLIMASVPAIAAILAFILLNETVGFIGICGMAITIFGIAIVVLKKKNDNGEVIEYNKRGFFLCFFRSRWPGWRFNTCKICI